MDIGSRDVFGLAALLPAQQCVNILMQSLWGQDCCAPPIRASPQSAQVKSQKWGKEENPIGGKYLSDLIGTSF